MVAGEVRQPFFEWYDGVTMNPSTEPRTARARRRARTSSVQHLVAADETSLADLEAMLATLPLCATGRVFIEVPDASDIGHVVAPSRMTVTWLPRSVRSGAPGTGEHCGRGAALTRAVTAWADEMLCETDDKTHVTLMGGYLSTADIVDHLTERTGFAPARIHAPEQFGLLPTQ